MGNKERKRQQTDEDSSLDQFQLSKPPETVAAELLETLPKLPTVFAKMHADSQMYKKEANDANDQLKQLKVDSQSAEANHKNKLDIVIKELKEEQVKCSEAIKDRDHALEIMRQREEYQKLNVQTINTAIDVGAEMANRSSYMTHIEALKLMKAKANDVRWSQFTFPYLGADKPITCVNGAMFQPDFNDFVEARRNTKFAVGQVWAIYDNLDGMPRRYAQVTVIHSGSKFSKEITPLNPTLDGDRYRRGLAGLPISCGHFTKAKTETCKDRLIFSHEMFFAKKKGKTETFMIYPRKGETWALFKSWNADWIPDLSSISSCELDIAEILSDDTGGVSIAYLSKIRGFSCLFCRSSSELESIEIPRSQMGRFSHRVPSFRLSGEEREDVPEGSFELDPAALPPNIEEVVNPKDPNVRDGNGGTI